MTHVQHGVEEYLETLHRTLAGVRADRRQAVVADVKAHIDDALESGQTVLEVLAGLGPAQDVAREYLGDHAAGDHAAGDHPPDAPTQAARLLQRAALVLAVVTAVFVTLLLPGYTTSDGGDATGTLAEQLGLGLSLLTLVPAGLVALVLLVPTPRRGAAGVAVAALVTALALATSASLGLFYGPVVLLAWLAVLVPALLRRGLSRTARRVWRIVGALVLLLPTAFTVSLLVSGSLEAAPALLGVAVAVLAVALAYARGSRTGYLLTTVLGAALLALAAVAGGLLVLGLWWFGGLWLALGLGALAAHDGSRPLRPA